MFPSPLLCAGGDEIDGEDYLGHDSTLNMKWGARSKMNQTLKYVIKMGHDVEIYGNGSKI